MQLYALDTEQQLIYAGHALKQQDYVCLECRQVVRVRSGEHRQVHYYHLSPPQLCRQNGKSMQHLQVQLNLQSILPQGECKLECRFPEINRIADVAWHPQKLVFEVQCSPITALEVKNRNQDYAKLGYHVIWILHDSQYNQLKVTAAESFLIDMPHYFTNMDVDGKGIIYDQVSMIVQGIRKEGLNPLKIDLRNVYKMVLETSSEHFPYYVKNRLKRWPVFFSGDFVDVYLIGGDNLAHVKELNDIIVEEDLDLQGIRKWYRNWVVRPYNLFFQMLLEKACR